MLNGRKMSKGFIFVLGLFILWGCNPNNSESYNETVGHDEVNVEAVDNEVDENEIETVDVEKIPREISGNVSEIHKDKLVILEIEMIEIDGHEVSLFNPETAEAIIILFNDETVVQIIEMPEGDWMNTVETEGTVADILDTDGIDVSGFEQGDAVFAERIVVWRVT